MKRIFIFLLFFTICLRSFSIEYYKSVGYGYIVSLKNDSVVVYDHTSVSLVKSMTGIRKDSIVVIEGPGGDIVFEISELTNDSLVLYGQGRNYYYYKIDQLPVTKYNDDTKDPKSCFEIFWHTFNEHCLLFDIANVDWNETYRKFEPLVTDTTSDSALYSIFMKMVLPLNDAHVELGSMDLGRTDNCGDLEKVMPWEINSEIRQKTIENYFGINKIYKSKSGYIVASHISGSTAYLSVSSFTGYAESYNLSEIESFIIELDSAISLIKDADNIILDISRNNGGFDYLSFELVSRFAKSTQVGYYKQVKLDASNNFSKKETWFVTPGQPSLKDKKLIVIVSPHTISAADVCAMLFKNLEGATLIGETSFGIFSDKLGKSLPNGFIFSLSNERYFDVNNNDYEQIGIKPDIEVKMDWSEISDRDNVLDSAINMLDKTQVEVGVMSNLSVKVLKSNQGTGLNIQVSTTGIYQLVLYDISGRFILKKSLQLYEMNNTIKLEGAFVSQHVYLGSLTGENNDLKFKFIY